MINVLIGMAVLHGLLWLACWRVMSVKHMPYTVSHLLWTLMLPVFGPVAGLILGNAADKEPPDANWLATQTDEHRRRLKITTVTENPVPLEEALLLNDPVERRKQMMNLLHSDPMENLDLLMLARFNEDAETAHYATATITELQRKIQLRLQQYQIDCQAHPEDIEGLNEYINLLDRYCTSGLLTGQVLRRQRMTLAKALDHALDIQPTPELAELGVINALVLEETDKVFSIVQDAQRLWPDDERTWLIRLRVCVEMHDQRALQALLESIQTSEINWTAASRERLQFWMEKNT